MNEHLKQLILNSYNFYSETCDKGTLVKGTSGCLNLLDVRIVAIYLPSVIQTA